MQQIKLMIEDGWNIYIENDFKLDAFLKNSVPVEDFRKALEGLYNHPLKKTFNKQDADFYRDLNIFGRTHDEI